MAEDRITVTVGRTVSPKSFHSIRSEVTFHDVPIDAEARGVYLASAEPTVRLILERADELAEEEITRITREQYPELVMEPPPTTPTQLRPKAAKPGTASSGEAAPATPPAPPGARAWGRGNRNGRAETDLELE